MIIDKKIINETIENGSTREHIALVSGWHPGGNGDDYHLVTVDMTMNDIKNGLQISSDSEQLEENVAYYNNGKLNYGMTALAKTHLFLLQAGDLIKSPLNKRDYTECMIDRTSLLHKFYNHGTEFSMSGVKNDINKPAPKAEMR